MTRIRITQEAYDVIASSIGEEMELQPAQAGPWGGVLIWLDNTTLRQLERLRGPGEDYSDVILQLAKMEAAQ